MTKVTTARYHVILRSTREEEPPSPPMSLAELAEHCDCEVELVEGLVSFGVIDPIGGVIEKPLFHYTAVSRLGRALRLRRDFRLDMDALALVMELLDRIEELESKGS